MTTPTEADAAIAAHMPAIRAETVALEAAPGRLLAQAAVAERDQPPFDRVTMDGIAIRYADWAGGARRLRVVGTLAAGAPAGIAVARGECIEIMTGAVLPAGVDTVVPVERLTVRDGCAEIAADAPVDAGQFIHRQGSDRHAGDPVIAAGTRIGPAEMAVLASAGYANVEVASRARVAVVSTGDELVGVEGPVAAYQIRSSNDHAIAAALERHALAAVSRHRLRDDEQALLDAIARLHDENDALILSGGVSMGQFDFVPAVLDALGCEPVFHKIEQKPGRPMWFGVSRDAKPVFALPGNPVSTLLCMTRYVVPAFRRAAGARSTPPLRYRLTELVRAPRHLTYFVPVVLTADDDRSAGAEPHPTNTSGDFATLAATDGFLELPPGRDEHPAGTIGDFYPW